MFNLTFTLIGLMAHPLPQGIHDAAAVRQQALELVGAVASDNGDAAAVEYHFDVPGFCDETFRARQSTSSQQIVLVDRPWAAAYLSVGSKHAPAPVLALVQDGASLLAVGTLTLPGGPGRRLEKIQAGCSLTCITPLPAECEQRELRVDFTWDLHSPVDPSRLFIQALGEGMPLTPIKMELSEPTPFVRLPARGADFTDSSLSTIRVGSGSGTPLELTSLSFPSCIELRSSRFEQGAIAIEVAETALATKWHACEPIRMSFRAMNDPEPVERALPIYHSSSYHDDDGLHLISGRFLPGEQVQLWRRADGALRFIFPDRVPCLSKAYTGVDARSIGSVLVPAAEGRFDLQIGTGDDQVRVLGTALRGALGASEGWIEVCQ